MRSAARNPACAAPPAVTPRAELVCRVRGSPGSQTTYRLPSAGFGDQPRCAGGWSASPYVLLCLRTAGFVDMKLAGVTSHFNLLRQVECHDQVTCGVFPQTMGSVPL